MDIGGLFGAVGNVITQGMANRANKKMTRETNQMQKQLADEAWARETAYNAPSAQMERYRAAGLNPHLIYGQNDNGYQYQTPDVETSQSVGADMSALSDVGIGTFQDVRMRRLQNDILDEELKQKVIDTDYKIENSELDVQTKRLLKRKLKREILGLDYANKITANDVKMIPVRNLRERLETRKVHQDIENSIKALNLQEKGVDASTFTTNFLRTLASRFLKSNSISPSGIVDGIENVLKYMLGGLTRTFTDNPNNELVQRVKDAILRALRNSMPDWFSHENTDIYGADF